MMDVPNSSPITSVETILDLEGDNNGPLTKFCNLDRGLLVTATV